MRPFLRSVAYAIAALSGVAIGHSLPSAPVPPSPVAVAEAPLPPWPIQLRDVMQQTATVAPPTAPAKPPDEPLPRWTLRTEDDAVSGFTDVYLSVASDRPLRCGPRRRAMLMLRCLGDRTSVYVAHDCATPSTGSGTWPVDLRLDGADVTSVAFEVDGAGEAFGHWDYRPARELIEDLARAETLHLRFSDLTGAEAEMRFPLMGLAAHLPTLRRACHWSEVPPWAPARNDAEGTAPVPAVAQPRPDGAAQGPDRPPELATLARQISLSERPPAPHLSRERRHLGYPRSKSPMR